MTGEAPHAPASHWNDQRHWELMLPPGRPSAAQLTFFRSALLRAPALSRVAVLGATPELRDLCVDIGIDETYVFDRNARFVVSMDRLRVYPNAPETVVIGDWSESLRRFPGVFDAVLSDLTLGNVAYEARDAFLDSVAASLADGGLYIDKVLTNAPGYLSLNALDRAYRAAPLNLPSMNSFSSHYFFASELAETHGVVDVARSAAVLRRRFETEPRLARMLDGALRLTTENGLWHYGRPWPRVRQVYEVSMAIHDEFLEPEPSPYAGRLSIFVSGRSGRTTFQGGAES